MDLYPCPNSNSFDGILLQGQVLLLPTRDRSALAPGNSYAVRKDDKTDEATNKNIQNTSESPHVLVPGNWASPGCRIHSDVENGIWHKSQTATKRRRQAFRKQGVVKEFVLSESFGA